VWQVGVVGLVPCGKVFAGWVGIVVGLHTMVGLVCGRTCAVCWGGAMVRFSQGRLALKLGLYAVLGWHWSSVTVSLVCRDRVVAVDLHVANRGSGGHGLHAVRWWQQGLARLEGQGMEVGIMWWRCGGLRTQCVG